MLPIPLLPLQQRRECKDIAIAMQDYTGSHHQQHRVLIYTACYNVIDGVTLTIRKIEKEILSSGGHVCIVTTKSGIASNTNIDGLFHPNRRVIFLDNSVPIPLVYDVNNPETQYHLGFSLSSQIQKQIGEFEPTVIHVTVPDCACLSVIEYARENDIPLMGTYHSNIVDYFDHYPGMAWIKPLLRAFFRHNYNFLQSLYVPTPFIRRHLTQDFDLDRCTKLKIWGRGIDINKFSPEHRCQSFRRKLGFGDDDVVIGMVGRLVPEKRPDIFARVMYRLDKEGVNFKALVVGTGPCQDKLKSIPNTTFVGWMTGDDLSMAYASCDIFLFPSSVETFGNVTLEAAASGLPLVVERNCSGHLVRDGFNGYACTAGDVDSFYDATLDLVLDRSKRRQYAINSRQFSLTLEQHSVVKEMLSNYTNVVNDFYGTYDGQHANRDEAWNESFRGGTQPKPFVLKLIVLFFVLSFRLLWFVTTCFDLFQGVVISLIISRVSSVIYSGVVEYCNNGVNNQGWTKQHQESDGLLGDNEWDNNLKSSSDTNMKQRRSKSSSNLVSYHATANSSLRRVRQISDGYGQNESIFEIEEESRRYSDDVNFSLKIGDW
eukprot:CAMPEP_0172481774 /NCGR_PEP_ID=MMETSP1066-20121228/7869_1 /TAXON_ID=671091 /ORGANISM="Coscinodiscus wailesii, Strain CCMP2513" /LENGTH=599 /DNA_ID=CAMNT_0013244367 /DNA_START=122 /DNA_END=1918 /DNA_ORIENTATION=+